MTLAISLQPVEPIPLFIRLDFPFWGEDKGVERKLLAKKTVPFSIIWTISLLDETYFTIRRLFNMHFMGYRAFGRPEGVNTEGKATIQCGAREGKEEKRRLYLNHWRGREANLPK